MSVRGCGSFVVFVVGYEREREWVGVNEFFLVDGWVVEEEVRRTRDTEPELVWMGLE